jgi:hypothetical protein
LHIHSWKAGSTACEQRRSVAQLSLSLQIQKYLTSSTCSPPTASYTLTMSCLLHSHGCVLPAAAVRNLETLVLTNNKIADVKVRTLHYLIGGGVGLGAVSVGFWGRGAGFRLLSCALVCWVVLGGSCQGRSPHGFAAPPFRCTLLTWRAVPCCAVFLLNHPQDLDPLSTLPHLTTVCLLGNPVAHVLPFAHPSC